METISQNQVYFPLYKCCISCARISCPCLHFN